MLGNPLLAVARHPSLLALWGFVVCRVGSAQGGLEDRGRYLPWSSSFAFRPSGLTTGPESHRSTWLYSDRPLDADGVEEQELKGGSGPCGRIKRILRQEGEKRAVPAGLVEARAGM